MGYLRFIFIIISVILFILVKYLLSTLALNPNYAFLVLFLWLAFEFSFKKLNSHVGSKFDEKLKRKQLLEQQKKRQNLLDNLIKTTVPNWTPDILQLLNSKIFIKLVAGCFRAKGFLIEYPPFPKGEMEDVFFLYKSNKPFAIVKCRAINKDIVSVDTISSFYDLSKQKGFINLALVTTGEFAKNDAFQNRRGFNLIGVLELISLLSQLPISEQTYLFVEMLIDSNNT